MPEYTIKIGRKGVSIKTPYETIKMRSFYTNFSPSHLSPWLKTVVTGVATKLIYSEKISVDRQMLVAAVLVWWLVEYGQKTLVKIRYSYLEKYKSFRISYNKFRVEGKTGKFIVKNKSPEHFKIYSETGKLLYDTKEKTGKFELKEISSSYQWKILDKACLQLTFESHLEDDLIVLCALTNYLLKKVRTVQVKIVLRLVLGSTIAVGALTTLIKKYRQNIEKSAS